MGITPQTNSAELFADDRLIESLSSLTSYDITIGKADLSPEDQAFLLGQDIDEDGTVYSSTELNQPFFAVSFRAQQSDGSYQYRQMFKVKFAPTDETYNTKGETPEFQTESLTGIAMPLQHNGRFDRKVIVGVENAEIAETFFEDVKTEKATP